MKIVHLIVLLLLFSSSSAAQQAALKFKHFSKQDGINQSSVNFIYQDYQDYLWVANFGGINKFDGYNFSSFVNDFEDSSSIADNSVWCMYERQDSSLWFGTKTGLSRYNRAYNNFTNFSINPQDYSSNVLAVKTLYEDRSKRFLIGTEGEGLYYFIEEEARFKRIELIPSHAKVSAITEGVTGELWIGTENLGLFKITADGTQVVSFQEQKTLSSTTIWSLCTDVSGTIWIGTDKEGLISFHEGTGFTFHKQHKAKNQYQAGNKIKTIALGHDGEIWLGSATKGLSYYDPQKQRFYNYSANTYDDNSLFDNDVSSIYVGSNDVLFVGFYMKGFDKVIKTPFHTIKHHPLQSNTLSNNNVYCMYLDHEEQLWLGTFGGGLNRYHPTTGEFEHFLHDESAPYSISHNWVRIIFEDSKNRLWVGTWGGGLNRFDRKTKQFKRYLPHANSNSLNLNIVTALFEDDDGELWVGTYGGGINIYQPETDDFRSIKHDKYNPNSLSDDHITSFYQDEAHTIWICTYGGGLNAYNKETKTFTHYLPDHQDPFSLNNYKTLHIVPEKDSSFFWITTLGGGINKFDYSNNHFTHFTENDGLSNNSTMGMLKDRLGRYWISSNHGISRFDPHLEQFTNYTMIDGLGSDDFNLEAFAQTKDGTMYFGGKNGISYFKPNDINSDSHFPKLLLTKIKVNDSLYSTIPSTLIVPYESHVVLEYAAINPNKTAKINYAYRLLGRDEKWLNEATFRHLEFKNLRSGNYTLQLKSTNETQVWNPVFSTIEIQVLTPWYMTWQFRSLVVCGILLLFYGYYRMKLQQKEALNQLLKQKVAERTQTIHAKNEALKIEKEKTVEAYKQLQQTELFKNELTNMVVHDLKNPLVTILNYSSKDSHHDDLGKIHQSGNKMLYLIENMLDIQKFEEAKIQLRVRQFSIAMLVEEAFQQVSLLAQEKRIQLIHQITPQQWTLADADIIERVLVNLLTNAIKFSPTDSQILVRSQLSEDGDQYTMSVQDYGKGIPKNQLHTIFDKYSQVEAVASGSIKSTGLGLTFCKKAMEAHNSSIWVISEKEQGSTFYFHLPISNAPIGEERSDLQQSLTKASNHASPFDIQFSAPELNCFLPYINKIQTLSLYETGEWIDIFEQLKLTGHVAIQTWCTLMMESLSSFDEHAFVQLKNIPTQQQNNAASGTSLK